MSAYNVGTTCLSIRVFSGPQNVDKKCPRFLCPDEDLYADEQQSPKIADNMAEPIHIGHIIQEELRTQGRTVTWLAKQLNLHRRACYRIFDCYSIDTHLLFRISQLLGRDFFSEFTRGLVGDDM